MDASPKERKRVLLLIPNMDFGGAQRSLSKLSFELALKYEVYFTVFNTECGVAFAHAGELINLEVSAGKNVFSKIGNFFKRVTRLRKIKQSKQIDVTISFLEGADYVNVLSRVKSEKVILSIRGSKSEDKEIQGWLGFVRKKMMIPYLYNKADHIVSVSKGIQHELIKDFGIRKELISTIYNFYDIDLLLKKSAEDIEPELTPLFSEKKVIINAGRFHVQKNFSALIDIFVQVLPSVPDTKLVLIGDGGLKEELSNKAVAHGLKVYIAGDSNIFNTTYDVYFLGYKDNPLQYIHRSNIFAFTSSWEGFPNGLAEAMVAGAAVVSTDCPTGPREIMAPETFSEEYTLSKTEVTPYGLLMPLLHHDHADYNERTALWAKELITILHNENARKQYIENASALIKNFSIEKITSGWISIIER